MANSWMFNPADPNGIQNQVLTQDQARKLLSKWFQDTDAPISSCESNVNTNYIRLPDGVYWFGDTTFVIPSSISPDTTKSFVGNQEGASEPEL